MSYETSSESELTLRGPVSTWPDSWLISAVCGDEVDDAALQALVDRHWRTMYGRCELLTLDRERARDLAQETWMRVLRARRTLRPDGNFAAYVRTIATNIWRDQNRSSRNAAGLADGRLLPLDATFATDDRDSVALADTLPDVSGHSSEEELNFKLDFDRAVSRLTPQLREVLVARYVDGESAAEIAKRFGRTQQTITTWLRQALHQMKGCFDHSVGNRSLRNNAK
jgi:RNA polymerase sigma-70 factor (ECF subfamily)